MHGGSEDVFNMSKAQNYHEILVLFVVVCCMYRKNKCYEVSAAWTEGGRAGGGKKRGGGWSHRARLVDKGPGYINVIHRLNSDSIQSNIKFKDWGVYNTLFILFLFLLIIQYLE